MFDIESIQSSEDGKETESPSLESVESHELNTSTFEPESIVEQTQSIEQAEEIESTFIELAQGTIAESQVSEVPSNDVVEATVDEGGSKLREQSEEDVPSLPLEISESEIEPLQITAVGKGPVPDYSPELSESREEGAPESSPQPSEAVIDVIAKVLSDSEFREKFFSKPEEALENYELSPDELESLGALKEESINNFANELEQRNVGFAPPYAPVRPSDEELVNVSQLLKAELTDEDIHRLLG